MSFEEMMTRINALIACNLEAQQFSNYLTRIIFLLVELLRNIEGDEFAQGWLAGAQDNIAKGNPSALVKAVKH